MNRSQKKEMVQELNTVFKSAEIVIVAQQNGLTVAQSNSLRSKMRAAGARFKVAKNNLAIIALKGTEYEGLTSLFTGPTLMAWSNDHIVVSKIIYQFAKENEKLVIMGGAIKSTMLSAKDVMLWATLPTLDEIRGKLVGIIQEPAAGLARLASAYGKKDAA